jgi:hypothetical protein
VTLAPAIGHSPFYFNLDWVLLDLLLMVLFITSNCFACGGAGHPAARLADLALRRQYLFNGLIVVAFVPAHAPERHIAIRPPK